MLAFTPVSDPRVEFGFFDDFASPSLNATIWTAANDGTTGTNLFNSASGGTMSIVTAGADNDYHWLHTNAIFRFLSGKPFYVGTRLSLTEAATNAANIVFGVTSVVDATATRDNGAGPPTSGSFALFTKVDGGSAWNFAVSVGSAQQSQAAVASFTSGSFVELGLSYQSLNSTLGIVTPYVNNVPVGAPVTFAIASAALMRGIVGVKAGSTSAESLVVDWFGIRQAR